MQSLSAQYRRWSLEILCIFLQKEGHQVRDVLFPLAQGRQSQADSANAVIEILAETMAFYLAFKVVRTAEYQARSGIPAMAVLPAAGKHIQELVLAGRGPS